MVQCAVGRGDIALRYLHGRLSGNRNGSARLVLSLVRRWADSVPEILTWALFQRAGIQCRMHVQLTGIGEVDFLVEEFLVVEIDGSSHWEKSQFKKDRRRDNRSVLGGLWCSGSSMKT